MQSKARTPLIDLTGRTRFRVVLGFAALGLFSWVLLERETSNLAYFVVTSESMEPTIKIGDRLIMRRPAAYRHGDIVVLEQPGAPKTLLVKRIAGMGGDRVEVRMGQLYVNGVRNLPPGGVDERVIEPDNKRILRTDEVFVVGDNRARSADSRSFGPVQLDTLRGVVIYRLDSLFHWVRLN